MGYVSSPSVSLHYDTHLSQQMLVNDIGGMEGLDTY